MWLYCPLFLHLRSLFYTFPSALYFPQQKYHTVMAFLVWCSFLSTDCSRYLQNATVSVSYSTGDEEASIFLAASMVDRGIPHIKETDLYQPWTNTEYFFIGCIIGQLELRLVNDQLRETVSTFDMRFLSCITLQSRYCIKQYREFFGFSTYFFFSFLFLF